jgi:hypothetical protein
MADEMDLEFLQVEFDKEWMEFLELMAPAPIKEEAQAVAEPAKKSMTHTEFLYDQCPELRKVMENFAGDLAYHTEMTEKDVPGPSDKDTSGQKGPSNGGGGKRPSNNPRPVQPEPPKPVARGRNRAWVESLKDKYTVIKGHVQSGKTNFMICASALFVSMGYSVVHLLRDRTSDRDQIHGRLLRFQEDHNKAFGQTMRVIKTAGAGAKSVDSPQIYLALCNKPSVTKVLSIVNASKRPYILFIDEVDFVDSGDATKKYEAIQDMKKSAYCVFGVSATIMDPLGKENITSKNIILLGTESKHGVYKGVDRIQLLEIDSNCKYTGLVDSNLFKEDEGLKAFVDEFVTRQPIRYVTRTHPNICLVNICRTKGPCFKAQIELGKTHPKLATIVYNGDGISFRQGRTSFKERTTISSCLQKLKDNGGVAKYPHIMIFAGDLAGRCISFVSEDYTWHLSDQRLLISSSCDEPELIQKIRLCGVYNDDIPLRLYTTKKTISELRKAYLRQEEIICALKSHECDESDDTVVENTRTLMASMALSKAKFGRRNITKDEKADVKIKMVDGDEDGGWDVDAYKMAKTKDGLCVPKALPPPSFYEAYGRQAPSEAEYDEYEEEHEDEEDLEERKKSPYIEDDEDAVVIEAIEKSIEKGKGCQSTFLSELANRGLDKTFTYKEVIEMLMEAKYKEPAQILPSYCGKKATNFGFNHKLFNVSGQFYTVRPELHIAWRS